MAAPEPTHQISYPVTDGATYSLYYSTFPFLSNYYLASPFYETFREKTGVTIDLNELGNSTYSEKMNLTIASGDYPDMATGLVGLFSSLSEAISEEVVLDVMPYVEENMPDYYAAATAYVGGLASITNEDGQMGVLYELYTQPDNYSSGYFVRDDYLQAAGYTEVPDNVDDFVDMLRAMKIELGIEYPLYANSDGDVTGSLVSLWYNDWGNSGYYWDEASQTVKWCHDQPYTLEYWQWFRGIYEEGLFLTSGTSDLLGITQTFNDFFRIGEVAVFSSKASTIDDDLSELEVKTTASAIPVFTCDAARLNGELVKITGGNSVSLTTDAQNPEILLQAINYLYTDEGALLYTYGTEGVSFNYNSEGVAEYTDAVMNTTDAPRQFALKFYTCPTLPGLNDPFAMSYMWPDYAMEALGVWSSAYDGNSATFSTGLVSLNQQESDVINLYLSDLNTYIEETVYRMLYGGAALDQASYDDFINTCYNGYHLQEILDVYTAAWQRYLVRAAQ